MMKRARSYFPRAICLALATVVFAIAAYAADSDFSKIADFVKKHGLQGKMIPGRVVRALGVGSTDISVTQVGYKQDEDIYFCALLSDGSLIFTYRVGLNGYTWHVSLGGELLSAIEVEPPSVKSMPARSHLTEFEKVKKMTLDQMSQ